MIGVQCLIDKINSTLAGGGLTSLQTCQLNGALASLTSTNVISVATVNDLPDADTYIGRMIYVDDINSYRYSNGTSWVDTFTSTLQTSGSILYSWGDNLFGELGDNTTTSKSSPVSVVGGFTDWCDVTSSRQHTVAVRTDGTAWAWGYNYVGRLGDCTTTNRSSPVSVVGGFADWRAVSSSEAHTIGLRTNGSVWSWGCNGQGRLGDCTTTNRSSPVSVVGGFVDWCQISAGCGHNLGVRTNGSVWAWGNNSCGVLGDCTTTNRSSPVSVVGGFVDWCQVSAGGSHSLGLRTNGSVWAWGLGTCGRLGDCTTTNRSSPVSVVGGFIDWCRINAGSGVSTGGTSAAIRTNGTLWMWGNNSCGVLGDNTVTNRSSPVSVVGGFTDWCAVSVGFTHALGVRTDGTAWAWGYNSQGELGNNSSINSTRSPVIVAGGFTDWCDVSAGSEAKSHAIRQKFRGF